MIEIKFVDSMDELETIESLAQEIWPVAYADILSKEQLTYMLKNMYSQGNLQKQFFGKQQFVIISEKNIPVGFASFEHLEKETKIHKLYVLSEKQGSGFGKLLIDFISHQSKKELKSGIILNVNKFNKAKDFYSKIGFSILSEEIIEIGNGFVMDDYIMYLNF